MLGTDFGTLLSINAGVTIEKKNNALNISDSIVNDIVSNDFNTLFIATNTGIGRMNSYNYNSMSKIPLLDYDIAVNKLFVYEGNIILAATTNGLAISNQQGNDFRFMTQENGLPDNTVNDIAVINQYEDDIKIPTIYAATNSGIYVARGGNNFKPLNSETENMDIPITRLWVNDDGIIYMISDDTFYYSYNFGQTFKSNKLTTNSNIQLNCILVEDLIIYIGTTEGLYISLTAGNVFFHRPFTNSSKLSVFSQNIISMYIRTNEHEQKTLYLGTPHNILQSIYLKML